MNKNTDRLLLVWWNCVTFVIFRTVLTTSRLRVRCYSFTALHLNVLISRIYVRLDLIFRWIMRTGILLKILLKNQEKLSRKTLSQDVSSHISILQYYSFFLCEANLKNLCFQFHKKIFMFECSFFKTKRSWKWASSLTPTRYLLRWQTAVVSRKRNEFGYWISNVSINYITFKLTDPAQILSLLRFLQKRLIRGILSY